MKQIKETRQALGLTQVEFGKLCGVRGATVLLWEKGRRSPSGSARLIIATLEERENK